MNERIEVRTQAELDRAVKNGDFPVCVGNGRFEARGSSHVEARGSSHVEARESSHVVARGSSHVVAWGSSHVVAWESSHVEARGSSHVEATAFVAVHDYGPAQRTPTQVNGGVIITVPRLETPEQWCEFHGVTVIEGIATLYKAVRDDWCSSHGMNYAPGSTPEAPDWDPIPECGGGLHFGASPAGAKTFDPAASRFLACPVALIDMVVHPDGAYPSKVKARRVSAPGCVEVDVYGRALEATG